MNKRNLKMAGAWLCLLFCLFSLLNAHADAYILHEPSTSQLQEEEAVELACAFVKELTGVELTGLYMVEEGMKVKNKTEAYFGPGNQWGANTEDDCWAMAIRNDTHIEPFVVLHGTTGEVLYWEYHDEQKTFSYIQIMPQEEHLSYDEAVAMAQKRYTCAVNGRDGAEQKTYVQLAFGPASNWNRSLHTYEDIPAWSVIVRTPAIEPEYLYDMLITAQDGVILDEGLFCRSEGWEFENITDQVNFEP